MSALVPANQSNGAINLSNLQDIMTLGDVLAKSGFFKDAKTAAQAVVKVLAGRELGFPTIASMVGIHIIEGKPSVGSHLLAAAIRGSGRYDYEIVEHSDHVCTVRFKRKQPDGNWANLEPVERLTLKEAVEKGWTVNRDNTPKGPWQKTPKNMLFSRCLTNGHKFHCPDLFSGMLVYDQDELEPSAGPVITDAEYTTVSKEGDIVSMSRADLVQGLKEVQASQMEEPSPNLPTPAPTSGTITEQEVEGLVQLARQHKRTQFEVSNICKVMGVPVLQKAPRERLGWLWEALKTGLVQTTQVDRITALVTSLQLDWAQFRSRMKGKFGAESIAHLLPSQADQMEATLKEALAKRQQQPQPA